jgi:hypothetical protein
MVGATRPDRLLLVVVALIVGLVCTEVALVVGVVSTRLAFAPHETSRAPLVRESPELDSASADLLPVTDHARPDAPGPHPEPDGALADLLPTPPEMKNAPVYLGDDLKRVPELRLEALPAVEVAKCGTLTTEDWISLKGGTSAGARTLDDREENGFVKALRRTRPDLAGLPFLIGDACRTKGARALAFKTMAERTRRKSIAEWDADSLAEETRIGSEKEQRRYRQAHAAVLAQILPTDLCYVYQRTIVQALALIREPEATRELARIAVFSPEKLVRKEALAALADREPGDSTEVLVAGLTLQR